MSVCFSFTPILLSIRYLSVHSVKQRRLRLFIFLLPCSKQSVKRKYFPNRCAFSWYISPVLIDQWFQAKKTIFTNCSIKMYRCHWNRQQPRLKMELVNGRRVFPNVNGTSFKEHNGIFYYRSHSSSSMNSSLQKANNTASGHSRIDIFASFSKTPLLYHCSLSHNNEQYGNKIQSKSRNRKDYWVTGFYAALCWYFSIIYNEGLL